MTKKEMVKAGVKLLVSFGVGTVVTNAVSATTPVGTLGTLKNIGVAIGSFAMSAFASDKISDYADEKIDELIDEAKKVVSEDETREEACEG